MFEAGWLIGALLLGLLAGAGGGWLAGVRLRPDDERVRTLETELTQAREALAEYRRQVVDQFTETARKFRTLNDAYADLHRQLAVSSSELCGDPAGLRLEAPKVHQDLLPEAAAETAAAEAAVAETAVADAATDVAGAEAGGAGAQSAGGPQYPPEQDAASSGTGSAAEPGAETPFAEQPATETPGTPRDAMPAGAPVGRINAP